MSWLYSQYLTFQWKLLVLVSKIQKSGTRDNNFGKFRSDRPKWPDRSLWTTFKAGPDYSGRTKRKWSVPFAEPTKISAILGWMESAPRLCGLLRFSYNITSVHINQGWVRNSERDPFNQNFARSDREKRSTSKGGPVFSKLFRLDRTDSLSFGPKFWSNGSRPVRPLMIWWALPARNQHLLKFSLTENRFCRHIRLSLSRELSTHLYKCTE